jgi:UDP-N-acetylglucosamine--N-acetylmuramyl-(pentapeptide) pyrophosphoryl-undecaprenol N-acetylglucosamine transferase
MERQIVERRGLSYYALPARAVVGRGLLERVMALAQMGRSSLAARQWIRRSRVRVVLGTGGYVSVPAVLGAALAGCPAVLLEPNAAAGAANRWLSRRAAAAAVTFKEVGTELHCPVHHTGVPVRKEFFAGPERPPAEGPLRVLVLGGSQGARQINRLLPAALRRLEPPSGGLQIVHQVGEDLLQEARQEYEAHDLSAIEIEIVPFLEDVAGQMAASHLVISRAGAITLSEICAAGRAALLLPLVLAGGHQLANARRLEATGGAAILGSDTVTPELMAGRLADLLRDRQRLVEMGQTLRSLASPRAAEGVANLLVEVAEAA